MHHPTDRIAHTTAFVTPVVEHWLERKIAQWLHHMKDRSDDPLHPFCWDVIKHSFIHSQKKVNLYQWATVYRFQWTKNAKIQLRRICGFHLNLAKVHPAIKTMTIKAFVQSLNETKHSHTPALSVRAIRRNIPSAYQPHSQQKVKLLSKSSERLTCHFPKKIKLKIKTEVSFYTITSHTKCLFCCSWFNEKERERERERERETERQRERRNKDR